MTPQEILERYGPREAMEYDVLVIGAGPGGLATAIRIKQLGAEQGKSLGVEIFPGFAAAEVLYNDDGSVRGVATGNLGIGRDGEPTANFQLGMELHAKYTVFAEGARGHLGKQLIAKFKLDEGRDPPSWAIGIKELWEVDPAKHQPGLVVH